MIGYGGIEQVFKPEIDAAVRKAVEKERKESHQDALQYIRKLIQSGVSDEMLYEAFKKSDVDEIRAKY